MWSAFNALLCSVLNDYHLSGWLMLQSPRNALHTKHLMSRYHIVSSNLRLGLCVCLNGGGYCFVYRSCSESRVPLLHLVTCLTCSACGDKCIGGALCNMRCRECLAADDGAAIWAAQCNLVGSGGAGKVQRTRSTAQRCCDHPLFHLRYGTRPRSSHILLTRAFKLYHDNNSIVVCLAWGLLVVFCSSTRCAWCDRGWWSLGV